MSDIKIPISISNGSQWTLHYLDVVDSTNRVAAALANDGSEEGQVVLADHQSSGRGRLDRSWTESPGTSVLMSLLLRPKFPSEFFYLITSALSIAASNVLESKFLLPCQLKWPNDLMVSDKKIAGVLAEVSWDKISGPAVVIGMGLNCNQSLEELISLGRPATSIYAEVGRTLALDDRIELTKEIVSNFANYYLALEDPSNRISVASLYRNKCETVGNLVMVEMPGETLMGVATDITVEGNLVVESESGVRSIPAGDVVHLRKGD